MSDRVEHTFVLLRHSLGGDRPSQTTQHTLSLIKSKLESQSYKGGISRMTPPELASKLQSLPPILHI